MFDRIKPGQTVTKEIAAIYNAAMERMERNQASARAAKARMDKAKADAAKLAADTRRGTIAG